MGLRLVLRRRNVVGSIPLLLKDVKGSAPLTPPSLSRRLGSCCERRDGAHVSAEELRHAHGLS